MKKANNSNIVGELDMKAVFIYFIDEQTDKSRHLIINWPGKYTYAHTHTRTHPYTHARTHTHTQTFTRINTLTNRMLVIT